MIEDACRRFQNVYSARFAKLRVYPDGGASCGVCIVEGVVRVLVFSTLPSSCISEVRYAWIPIAEGSWYEWGGPLGWSPIVESDAIEKIFKYKPQVNAELRRIIVSSIKFTHEMELQGYLAGGFIQRLNQQFPKAELYLFELLQNAVDEGASRVLFRLSGDVLTFQHNGAPFDEGDIVGLSSIAASGKSGRTIGFMGLGFKSIYSRFDSVHISDLREGQSCWSLKFQKPPGSDNDQWKVLPYWVTESKIPEHGFTCRFDLGQPRGGARAVEEDLKKLPDVVPVLLARRSQFASETEWTLDWNGRTLRVKRHAEVERFIERFSVIEDQRETFWCFIKHTWMPSAPAKEAWRKFRDGDSSDPGEQELCAFVEVDEFGNLRNQTEQSFIHSILPTSLVSPIGFHLNASWLLSADRQQVMSPADQPWNLEIANQFPALLKKILKWAASESGPKNVGEVYRRLPALKQQGDDLILEIVGEGISCAELVTSLTEEELLPVLRAVSPAYGGNLSSFENAAIAFRRQANMPYNFVSSSECVFIPDSLIESLSPWFIDQWLGQGRKAFAFSSADPASGFFKSCGVLSSWDFEVIHQNVSGYACALRNLPDDKARAWAVILVTECILKEYDRREVIRILDSNGILQPVGSLKIPDGAFRNLDRDSRAVVASYGRSLPSADLLELFSSAQRIDPGFASIDRVRSYLEQEVVKLQQVMGDVFEGLRECLHTNPQTVSQVVNLTRSLSALNVVQHSAVPLVLVDDPEGVQLRSKDDVWLGDCYGFPNNELLGKGVLSFASDKYKTILPDTDWSEILLKICNTCIKSYVDLQRMYESHKLALNDGYVPLAFEGKYLATNQVGGDTSMDIKHQRIRFKLGDAENVQHVHVFGSSIGRWEEIIQKIANAPTKESVGALALVLINGQYFPAARLTFKNQQRHESFELSPFHLYVTWMGRKDQRFYSKISKLPSWISMLKEKKWVPLGGGEFVVPADAVLDSVGYPLEKLAGFSQSTRDKLKAYFGVLLGFGGNVPKLSPLDEIVSCAESNKFSNADLVELWKTQIDKIEKLDADGLLRVRDLQIFPYDKTRKASLARLTAVSVDGFNGYYLCFEKDDLSVLWGKIVEKFSIEAEPKIWQLVSFLKSLENKSFDEISDAYFSAWHSIGRYWETKCDEVKEVVSKLGVRLFCNKVGQNTGVWLDPSKEQVRNYVLWNDAPSKFLCLKGEDGFYVESVMAQRAKTDDLLKHVPDIIGIERLSGHRFNVKCEPQNAFGLNDESDRLVRLLELSHEIVPKPEWPNLSLVRVVSIDRTFSIDGILKRSDNVDAYYDGNGSIYVVGDDSAEWAPDLLPQVKDIVQFPPNDPSLRLLDLLSLLSRPEQFSRKLKRVCEELGISQSETSKTEEVHSPSEHIGPSVSDPEGPSSIAEVTSLPPPPVVKSSPSGSEGVGGAARDSDSGSSTEPQRSRSTEVTPRGPMVPFPQGGAPASNGQHEPKKQGSRLLSYVSPKSEPSEVTARGDGSIDEDPHSHAVGRAATGWVLQYERSQNRKPVRMGHANPGYDIVSKQGRLVERYIEVKGINGEWGGEGVSLSAIQFNACREFGDKFWLYVVENALGDGPIRIHTIQNPAHEVSKYCFDSAWQNIAEMNEFRPPEPIVGGTLYIQDTVDDDAVVTTRSIRAVQRVDDAWKLSVSDEDGAPVEVIQYDPTIMQITS